MSGPDSAALLEQFETARSWVRELESLQLPVHGAEWEYKEINHRQLGRQRLPTAFIIHGADAAAALLKETANLQHYRSLKGSILTAFPALGNWVVKKPHKVLDSKDAWPGVLAFLSWLQKNPTPQIYLRQVDLPGIHTKFVETWKTLITEAAQEIGLPLEQAPTSFEKRFGFLSRPALVRFRFLDSNKSPGLAGTEKKTAELSLRAGDLAGLNPDCSRVLIVENEITWLALPDVPDTLAVWGSGYGFDSLKDIGWLKEKQVLYWSDLDTHGFAMLDQLRSILPQTQSFLMDKTTLLEHSLLWTPEPSPAKRELDRLTKEECELFHELSQNSLGQNVRLEQERIGFNWIKMALQQLL